MEPTYFKEFFYLNKKYPIRYRHLHESLQPINEDPNKGEEQVRRAPSNVVLLLHGFGEDGYIWEQVTEHLKGSAEFIVPDIPGSGASPFHPEWENLEELGAAFLELMQSITSQKITVIGHSMGGYIALAMAEKAPELIQSLWLFHSTAYADHAAKIEARKKGISFVQQYGGQAFLKQTIPNLFAETNRKALNAVIEELTKRAVSISDAAIIWYYESMMKRPNRTAVLKNADFPVVFIIGKQDMAVPFEEVMQQVALPKVSVIEIFDQAGHMAMFEEKEAILTIMEKFFDELFVTNGQL